MKASCYVEFPLLTKYAMFRFRRVCEKASNWSFLFENRFFSHASQP